MTTSQNNVNVNSVKSNAIVNDINKKDISSNIHKSADLQKKVSITAADIKAKRAKEKLDAANLVKAVDASLSTGRNFYAVKENSKGQEIHYAFETVHERNQWINRHEGAHSTSALSVYRAINRNSDEIIATNRNHRVIKVPKDAMIDLSKGQRVLIK